MLDVLVTGSRGFIGQHLVKELLKIDRIGRVVGVGTKGGETLQTFAYNWKYGKYIELNVNICKQEEVAALLSLYQPHVIFHLAAIPVTKLNELAPTEVTQTNILGTQNLLHYAKYSPRFVFASSATVYGDCLIQADEYDTLMPTSVYGATKVAGEALVNAYTSMGRVNGISLRYVANVGEGATHGVLPDVIRKLRSDNPNLELFGNEPGATKPYMHISDTVKSTIYFGLHNNDSQPVNIAPINSISIDKLANIVMDTTKIMKPIKWLGSSSTWAGDNNIVRINCYRFDNYGIIPLAHSEKAIEKAVREL